MNPSIILILLFVTSCSKATDPKAREIELSFLRCLMPESLLEFSHVEVPAAENIAILGEGAEQHLGLHIFPAQKKLHGGIRAEISVDFPHQSGDTIRYAWRFMVPEGFTSDAPRNRWWLIGQWHDQPDKTRNESWEKFPSNSPPVLISLGEIDGKLGLGLAYGPKQDQKHGPIFIKPGKWHQLTVDIHWSQKSDGKATIYLDDLTKPTATFTGPNMHNAYQHYLKFGMYRHPEIATDNWIYIDDLTIAKSAM